MMVAARATAEMSGVVEERRPLERSGSRGKGGLPERRGRRHRLPALLQNPVYQGFTL
jgi:hypothetical protein